jgi:putative lipase involved disintegration of autophagic bodies
VDEEELTMDNLVKEALEVIDYLHSICDKTNIVIIGHGLGGAIASKAVSRAIENNHQSAHLIQGKLKNNRKV